MNALAAGKRMVMVGLLVIAASAVLAHPGMRRAFVRTLILAAVPFTLAIVASSTLLNSDLVFADKISSTFRLVESAMEQSDNFLETLIYTDPARYSEYVSLLPHLTDWSFWFGNRYGFRYDLDSDFLHEFDIAQHSDVRNAHFTPLPITAKFGLFGLIIWIILIARFFTAKINRNSFVNYACRLAFTSMVAQSLFAFRFFINIYTPFYIAMSTVGSLRTKATKLPETFGLCSTKRIQLKCAGWFWLSSRPVRGFVSVAHARQHYRGPDGEGVLFEDIGGVHMGMAHERLAIVGLSKNGAQPMLSASGRFRILFNGEVYNFRELAQQFGLHELRSGTDTEVIVELVERLGIDEAIAHFNGMWAMVIQDLEANRYYVSRDRFGKKPLYIHRDGSGVYMASEMHSLMGLPGVDLTPDTVTASRFLAQSLQNVDERSWLASIKAFPPASIGEIDGTDPAAGIGKIRHFWKPGYETPLPAQSANDSIEKLKSLVQDAIRLRLHADVPVGVALSGGIDSSIISVQATQTTGIQGQQTDLFSAVNPGSKEDESVHIDTMARHLDRDVHRFRPDPEEGDGLFGLLQTCIHHADGPVTSFSNLLFTN